MRLPPLHLDVVSDFVCPWCWVGKAQLRQALGALERPVSVSFRPYQLDPDIPAGGVDYRQYMRRKFASEEARSRLDTMRGHLMRYGDDLNLAFNFDAITVRPNTFDAHRVMRWAQGQGAGDAFSEAVFRAFFAEGRDIGSVDELGAIADQCGLDSAIVRDLISRDADRAAVEQEESQLRALGITGVPTLIADGRRAISGAQGAETFQRFLAA